MNRSRTKDLAFILILIHILIQFKSGLCSQTFTVSSSVAKELSDVDKLAEQLANEAIREALEQTNKLLQERSPKRRKRDISDYPKHVDKILSEYPTPLTKQEATRRHDPWVIDFLLKHALVNVPSLGFIKLKTIKLAALADIIIKAKLALISYTLLGNLRRIAAAAAAAKLAILFAAVTGTQHILKTLWHVNKVPIPVPFPVHGPLLGPWIK